jgi:hypothetical protein
MFFIALLLLGTFGLTPGRADEAATLQWSTFMGSSGTDAGRAIMVDGTGNVYVAGYSYATWGLPVNAHAGDEDAFVAKLDSNGSLQWHTFMGSAVGDYGSAIALDVTGNVYMTGYSDATWGTPVNAHAGGRDAFVAKLDSNGFLQWHTFLGSSSYDYCSAIALDVTGNVYVAGGSNATWGTPVNDHAGGDYDAFVAKLDSNGSLQWHTFLGSSSYDYCSAIALDASGNVYVAGHSETTWGLPVNAHAGGDETFAAKLDSSGSLQWHTFMGSSNNDYGTAIALDVSGNVYVAGYSGATWSLPVNAHAGDEDAFVAKLDSSGSLQWNTFMGSSSSDVGLDIALDGSMNVYLAGSSNATWGLPVSAHAGDYDVFAAKIDSSCSLQWNTFMGSSSTDYGSAIVLDGSMNVYLTGSSNATWGLPVNAHAGGDDAFATKLVYDSDDDSGCFIATAAR